MAMILEAFVKEITDTFVLLISYCGMGVSNQNKSVALVVFIKDVEKAIIGNSDILKSKLESLPQNVAVIGSHTQLDSRKDKVVFDYCIIPHMMAFYKQSLGPIQQHYLVFLSRLKYGLNILQGIEGEKKNSKKSLKTLENVKDTFKELVIPLQRSELFSKGQLAKPCKGILLFSPLGTGKTMLAKAVATEARANFINIQCLALLQ
ncbi:26S proteasome regulatory subunit 4 homolog [Arachis stenosperma]|uniref:26S proteasome regulatory subunit 4 homolog n=1 Tax=Arachis stenosperma TaxID=217475 RepID=UPI0025AB8CA6|nr:26S proteasome regulatory subunit 4 homolog [Arachis stenosperma]